MQNQNRMLIGNVKAIMVAMGVYSVFAIPPRPFTLALIILSWLFLHLVDFNEPTP